MIVPRFVQSLARASRYGDAARRPGGGLIAGGLKMTKAWAAFAAVMTAATIVAPAAAQDGPRVLLGVTGGTLGIGPEAGLRFARHIGVRASATFLNVSADFDSSDITYGGDLELKSYGAMVDLHPFGGSFRISGGARINRNRVAVRATPSASGTISVGGADYTAAQVGTLSGGADVGKLAPALTMGFGGSKKKGFLIGIESGILFQGRARLRQFTATGTAANDPAFRASLEAERQDLQEDIDKVKIYPIAQLMIGWRF